MTARQEPRPLTFREQIIGAAGEVVLMLTLFPALFQLAHWLRG
ncbi:hypothetical protein [Devosia sp. MC1541]|nr:hypothetical protein [Devosia sp. MC1541]